MHKTSETSIAIDSWTAAVRRLWHQAESYRFIKNSWLDNACAWFWRCINNSSYAWSANIPHQVPDREWNSKRLVSFWNWNAGLSTVVEQIGSKHWHLTTVKGQFCFTVSSLEFVVHGWKVILVNNYYTEIYNINCLLVSIPTPQDRNTLHCSTQGLRNLFLKSYNTIITVVVLSFELNLSASESALTVVPHFSPSEKHDVKALRVRCICNRKLRRIYYI